MSITMDHVVRGMKKLQAVKIDQGWRRYGLQVLQLVDEGQLSLEDLCHAFAVLQMWNEGEP